MITMDVEESNLTTKNDRWQGKVNMADATSVTLNITSKSYTANSSTKIWAPPYIKILQGLIFLDVPLG